MLYPLNYKGGEQIQNGIAQCMGLEPIRRCMVNYEELTCDILLYVYIN